MLRAPSRLVVNFIRLPSVVKLCVDHRDVIKHIDMISPVDNKIFSPDTTQTTVNNKSPLSKLYLQQQQNWTNRTRRSM